METIQKLDDNGFPIPGALAYMNPWAKITVAASSGRNATAFTYDVIRLTCTAAMNFKVGGAAVTAAATDHYIPANTTITIPLKNNHYIAVFGTGDAYISEMG